MNLEQAARQLLEPLGFEVLEFIISGNHRRRRVLLRIDRLDQQIVSMDDVTLATEVFSLELDRLDPFPDDYKLEVESPGPERPLIRREHFQRFCDLQVKVRQGTESFKAIVRSADDEAVCLELDGEVRHINYQDLGMVRLAEWPKEPR